MLDKVIHDRLDILSDNLKHGTISIKFHCGQVVKILRDETTCESIVEKEKNATIGKNKS